MGPLQLVVQSVVDFPREGLEDEAGLKSPEPAVHLISGAQSDEVLKTRSMFAAYLCLWQVRGSVSPGLCSLS